MVGEVMPQTAVIASSGSDAIELVQRGVRLPRRYRSSQ
jgi:hypothetical protein